MRRASESDGGYRRLRRRAVPWLISFAILTLFATSSASAQTKRVLMLFSNDSLLPAGVALGTSIQTTLMAGDPNRVEIFTETLDADRFPGPAHEARMESWLRDKYASIPIDLAIAIGPQALDFLIQRRTALFAGTPLIFAGISESSLQRLSLPPDTTGIASRFDPVQTLELALRLQPDARQVVVVTGAGAFDKRWEAAAREQLRPYAGRLQVSYLSGLPLPQLLQKLARLPERAIVLYLTIFEDGTGEHFIPRNLAPRISDAATAPVYSVYETYLGEGIVGGYMDSFVAIGTATARVGLRILAGASPEGLPPEEIQTQAFMVDWRQLRRWRLDEARLPPGTIVRFEQLSLWDRYRQQILAVIAVVILQSALIVALLLQARRRRRAEESLRQGEERYRNVVETQTELICRYLPDTTLTFVNDAYCRYFGRSREELVGSPFIGLIPEPERAAALQHIESIGLSPHAESYEHQVVRPDGSFGWQQWTDRAIRNAEGSRGLQGLLLQVDESEIVVHEAYDPNAVVDLLDAEALAGEHGRDVDPLSMHADAAAGGDKDFPVVQRVGPGRG